MTDDVRKLLAGYATGTLTEAERRELFEAALDDPELFAEIARDEPLREALAERHTRQQLLGRLEPARLPFRDRFALWIREPIPLAGLATAAVAIVILTLVPLLHKHEEANIAATAPAAVSSSPVLVPAPPAAVPAPEGRGKAAGSRLSRPAVQTKKAAASGSAPAPPPQPAPAEIRRQEPIHLRYTVWRRAGDEFVEAPQGTAFDAGELVQVRFEAASAGLLTVREDGAAQPLRSGAVKEREAFVVGPLEMTRERRLQVTFQPATPAAVGSVVSSLRAPAAHTEAVMVAGDRAAEAEQQKPAVKERTLEPQLRAIRARDLPSVTFEIVLPKKD